MRKEWIIAFIAIFLLIVSILLGIYVYKMNNTHNSNMLANQLLAQDIEAENELLENLLSASSSEEKISPNCVIVEKQYYKDCDHIIRDTKEVPEEYINYSKEEFEKEYADWDVEDFTSNQIIVYKENEGYCNEHYVIRENNGVLAVYTIDKNGEETLKETTEIQVMYLPQEDLEKFQQGIEVLGESELRSTLEDFE